MLLVKKLMQIMKIRVLFQPQSPLRSKIIKTYIDLYWKFKLKREDLLFPFFCIFVWGHNNLFVLTAI